MTRTENRGKKVRSWEGEKVRKKAYSSSITAKRTDVRGKKTEEAGKEFGSGKKEKQKS